MKRRIQATIQQQRAIRRIRSLGGSRRIYGVRHAHIGATRYPLQEDRVLIITNDAPLLSADVRKPLAPQLAAELRRMSQWCKERAEAVDRLHGRRKAVKR